MLLDSIELLLAIYNGNGINLSCSQQGIEVYWSLLDRYVVKEDSTSHAIICFQVWKSNRRGA